MLDLFVTETICPSPFQIRETIHSPFVQLVFFASHCLYPQESYCMAEDWLERSMPCHGTSFSSQQKSRDVLGKRWILQSHIQTSLKAILQTGKPGNWLSRSQSQWEALLAVCEFPLWVAWKAHRHHFWTLMCTSTFLSTCTHINSLTLTSALQETSLINTHTNSVRRVQLSYAPFCRIEAYGNYASICKLRQEEINKSPMSHNETNGKTKTWVLGVRSQRLSSKKTTADTRKSYKHQIPFPVAHLFLSLAWMSIFRITSLT